MLIRDAHTGDLEGITAIYNDAVLHTTAIWNQAIVDVDDRATWLAARQAAGYPVLVATDEDATDDSAVSTGNPAMAPGGTDVAAGSHVLGYASFGDWRAWEGYRYTVEHSVYVRTDQRGNGLGRALMVELIARARAAGKHVMVAGIEAGNIGSIRLHEKLGFTHAGHLTQVGVKFGSWLDLAFLQLLLDDQPTPPAPPAPPTSPTETR